MSGRAAAGSVTPLSSYTVVDEVSEHAHDEQMGERVADRPGGGRRVAVRGVDRDRDRASRLLGVSMSDGGRAVRETCRSAAAVSSSAYETQSSTGSSRSAVSSAKWHRHSAPAADWSSVERSCSTITASSAVRLSVCSGSAWRMWAAAARRTSRGMALESDPIGCGEGSSAGSDRSPRRRAAR